MGTEIIPSLSSNSALDSSQGTALINEIKSVGGSNYILLGHSQGGLVSRVAAQYFQNNPPNLTEGVVTVDTPHPRFLEHSFRSTDRTSSQNAREVSTAGLQIC